MGKASRWLINLLVGKKEDKGNKKKNISFFDDTATATATVTVVTPSSPNITTYKRWSFRNSATKERAHKFSRSLDSITPLITQHAAASLDWGNHPNIKTKIVAISQTQTVTRLEEHASATRIQAAFRSYLAKKALCALKALVKIQALVRGFLVRKQTTATMRQMHALMAIQVRARFLRIQLAQESSQLIERSQSSRHETKLTRPYKETINWNIYETERVLKHRHDYLSSSAKRREHKPRKYYSGELSISKRDQEYEFSFSTAHNSPQIRSPSPTAAVFPGRASFTYQKPDYVHPVPSPNYMSNTESSKAKVRSQSEPKQRPILSMRPKSKQADTIDAQIQGISSQSSHSTHESEDPWFTKVYSTTKPKNSDCDAKSRASSSSNSNYRKLLVTYEPHLNLY